MSRANEEVKNRGEWSAKMDEFKLILGDFHLVLLNLSLYPCGFHLCNQEAIHLLRGRDHRLLSRILEKNRTQSLGKIAAVRISCDQVDLVRMVNT